MQLSENGSSVMSRFFIVANTTARFLLRPWVIVGLMSAVVVFVQLVEKQWSHLPFIVNCLLVISLAIFAATRKLGFSFYAASAITVLICLVSTAKYRMKGFSFHIFDVFFTGSDIAVVRFLAAEYAHLIIPVVALTLIGILMLVVVARNENKQNVRLTWRLFALLTMTVALSVSYPLSAAQPRYFHYLGGFNASSFFVSLLDIRYLSHETELAERLNVLPEQPAFTDEVACRAPEDSPDVFFVLGESQINPAKFPQLAGETTFAGLYRSFDGVDRDLRVETFGGGTWVSHLSLL